MVEDATKVGKLFAHRMEKEDAFREGGTDSSRTPGGKILRLFIALILSSNIIRS